MHRYLFLSVFIISAIIPEYCALAQIQVAPDRYRVEFTDKNHNAYSVAMPAFFLSERALLRRAKQGIAVTQADLPVSAYYLDSLRNMNIEVLNVSRWFNSATIKCPAEDIEKLSGIDFIKKTSLAERKPVNDTLPEAEPNLEKLFSFIFRKKDDAEEKSLYEAPVEFYGKAADQIGMLNGQALHEQGFRGKGMLIAVIDGGFFKTDELSGFDTMRRDGKFLGIKNFTPDKDDVFGKNNHGANVLSIVATLLPGRMVGSAPDAEYILLRSEEIGHEYLVEEDNWIAAVEYADSIGADIISSSLGYSVFDDESQNHVYQDLDGKTIRTSYAATMAAARGMVVCVSAGNDGDMPWRYVSVPGDADSILTVGAVDRYKQYASFSSTGTTADGRVKPDVIAMGKDVAYQSSTGTVNTGNGTSYSTPLMAGMVACLWQAYPDKGNMEIIRMIQQSADRYHEPDSLYGYGIPDFSGLIKINQPETRAYAPFKVNVFPNPFTGTFTLFISPAQHGFITTGIYTATGRLVRTYKNYVSGFNAYELNIAESSNLPPGMYMVRVASEAGQVTAKAVKQ